MNWPQILRADPCCYCGEQGGCVDHIEPRSLGGADHESNLTGICRSCNSSKGQSSPLIFMIRGKGRGGGRKPLTGSALEMVARISYALQSARVNHGLSRRGFGEIVGAAPQTIARWESGQEWAVVNNMPRIAEAFDQESWQWLLDGEIIAPRSIYTDHTDRAAA